MGDIREGLKTTMLMNVEVNSSGDIVFKVDGLANIFSYLKSRNVVRLKDSQELPIPINKDAQRCLSQLMEDGFRAVKEL